jgi:hypothetical protein
VRKQILRFARWNVRHSAFNLHHADGLAKPLVGVDGSHGQGEDSHARFRQSSGTTAGTDFDNGEHEIRWPSRRVTSNPKPSRLFDEEEESMPPTTTTITANLGGKYVLEDDGIPGNNFSRIRFPNGTAVNFEHPTDDLIFESIVPAVTLAIDLADSLGTSGFTAGSLTDPAKNPESIDVRKLTTSAAVTLATTLRIRETNSDPDADIVGLSLKLSARNGNWHREQPIGDPGRHSGGRNHHGWHQPPQFRNRRHWRTDPDIQGLSVETSGNILLDVFGTILLSDVDGDQTIKGGGTSGNVTLIADGFDADVLANVDKTSIQAPNGKHQRDRRPRHCLRTIRHQLQQ